MCQPFIGFVGLGNMGAPMATNLLRAGYRLLVCDKSASAVSALVSAGAEPVSSPLELSTSPNIQAIITMLPSQAALHDVYLGRTGILAAGLGLKTPLLIDSSTASPAFAAELARQVVAASLHPGTAMAKLDLTMAKGSMLHGSDASSPLPSSSPSTIAPANGTPSSVPSSLHPSHSPVPSQDMRESCSDPDAPLTTITHPYFIDTPVSGGVPGARAGSLTFMAGGDEIAVSAATPLLLSMGQRVVHCGPAGAGQAAKLCNNLVLAICMGAVSEGMALGKGLGLDPKVLAAIFNTSSARCWSSDTYNPCPGVMPNVPSSNSYRPGFQATLMVKDLTLALESGQQTRAATPLGDVALDLYKQVAQHGTPLDFSAVYKLVYEAAVDKRV